MRIQKIPMKDLVGPGVIIDVQEKSKKDHDYRVSIKDLKEWEANFGQIPDGAIVVMNSGWYSRYPNKNLVFNTEKFDDHTTFHFPGWHVDTVLWLINNRVVKAVGVDTPSNDYGQSTEYLVHRLVAKSGLVGVENVANLDAIPQVGSTIFLPVIKLHDGSGGPVRAFATIPSPELLSNQYLTICLCVFVLTLSIMLCIKVILNISLMEKSKKA